MPLQILKVGDQGRELRFVNTDKSQRILPIPIRENGYWTNYVLEFGPDGMPIIPEVILAQRNGHNLGRIQNLTGLKFVFNLNSPNELSFNVDLYHDNNRCILWEKIVDFKLVYIPLFNLWFEISISNSEEDSVVKMVSGQSLNECELGQINLYGVEINTESDILRDDYEPTTIYNSSNPKSSMLDRLLEKAPHYKILHVDTSIARLQRTFTFNNTSLLEAFNDIAQEVSCIFIYGHNDGSVVPRTISVYDLYDYCPVCGQREEHMDTCPECGNKDIVHGYGEDTTIFASVENLADQINYSGRFFENQLKLSADITNTIASAAVEASFFLNLKAIVCMTVSGRTAQVTSYYRPACPIIACVTDEKAARQLNISYGVHPVMAKLLDDMDFMKAELDAGRAPANVMAHLGELRG